MIDLRKRLAGWKPQRKASFLPHLSGEYWVSFHHSEYKIFWEYYRNSVLVDALEYSRRNFPGQKDSFIEFMFGILNLPPHTQLSGVSNV
jgi:hypothetical protein